jgi:hypothetical protein
MGNDMNNEHIKCYASIFREGASTTEKYLCKMAKIRIRHLFERKWKNFRWM